MINLLYYLIFGEWKCHHKWKTTYRAENKVKGYYICSNVRSVVKKKHIQLINRSKQNG